MSAAMLRRLPAAFMVAVFLLGICPAAGLLKVNAADNAAAGGRLIVIWKTAPAVRVAEGATVSVSAAGRRSVVTPLAGETPAVAAARLRLNPDIKAVVPDFTVQALDWPTDGTTAPNDTYYGTYQADLRLIGMPAAWQTTTGSSSITVAVLDTGLRIAHPDLVGAHIVWPRNEITNTTDVTDVNGHGSHTAGTIVAQTNNATGIAGIASGVNLMPVKVLGDNGSGSWSDILDGIDWARTHGANVISMSLGGIGTADQFAPFQTTFDAAWMAGITVIASAGNSGSSGNGVSYPAALSHVISVAAVDNTPTRASFSTYNAWVDIAAPGVSTTSLTPGDWYAQMSGTSMAAPHVAGVAALVLSAHPTWTPAEVETALEQTATDLGSTGRDDYYGWGLVRADRAIAYSSGGSPSPTPSPTPTPAPGPTSAPTGPAPAFATAPYASPSTISQDPNGYCPTAVKSSTVTVRTAPGSATVGAATGVDLIYTRPGGTGGRVTMTKASESTTGATWTAAISTDADRQIATGGTLTFQARATSASGLTALSSGGWITISVCPNVAPAFGTLALNTLGLYTNPLGTGVMPTGAHTSFDVTSTITDTDGVASASLTLSGAGLAAPVTIAMTRGSASWTASADMTTIGVTGGAMAWKITATDGRGLAGSRSGSVAVTRANTPGSSSVTSIRATSGALTVGVTADDADVTWGTTRPAIIVTGSWSAIYTDATGAHTASGNLSPSWVSGHAFTATIAATWLTTAVTNLSVRIQPVTSDGLGGVTQGTASTLTPSVTGAPTIVAGLAGVGSVVTNPLGTGTVASGAATSIPFTVDVRDTDSITSVGIRYTGPGVTTARTFPLTLDTTSGRWTGTLAMATSGITGAGTFAWSVVAVDAAGATSTRAFAGIAVTRADTAGTATTTGVTAVNGALVIAATVDDPDTYWGATQPGMTLTLAWSATYTDVRGVVCTASGTGTALWSTGHAYSLTVRPAWLSTAITGLVVRVTPTTVDAYGGRTVGAAASVSVTPSGPAVIVASSTGSGSVYVNPLGTGFVPATGATAMTFTADVRDTAGISAVVASYTGPGVSTARTVALAFDSATGRWTGSVAMAASGITAQGTVTWRIVATDASGNVTTGTAATITVVRADTAGSATVTGYRLDASGNIVVSISASDPDGVALVQLKWQGTAAGWSWPVTYTTATLVSGVYTVTLPVGTYLRQAGSGSYSWQPIVRDAAGAYSPTSASTVSVSAAG